MKKIIKLMILLLILTANYIGYVVYGEKKVNEERVECIRDMLDYIHTSKGKNEEEELLRVIATSIDKYNNESCQQLLPKINPLYDIWHWNSGGKIFYNKDSTKIDSMDFHVGYTHGYVSKVIKPKAEMGFYWTSVWAE